MDDEKDTARVSIHVSPANSGDHSDHSIHSDHTDCPKNPFGDSHSCNTSLYFRDGNRSVDFVLVWKQLLDEHSAGIEETRMEKRKVFQQNLLKEGLEIEEETIEEEVMFIKVTFFQTTDCKEKYLSSQY